MEMQTETIKSIRENISLSHDSQLGCDCTTANESRSEGRTQLLLVCDDADIKKKHETSIVHLHRVEKNDQAWYFLRGDPLLLVQVLIDDDDFTNGTTSEEKSSTSNIKFTILGPDLSNGQVLSHNIAMGTWVAATVLSKSNTFSFSLTGRTFLSKGSDDDISFSYMNEPDLEKDLFQLHETSVEPSSPRYKSTYRQITLLSRQNHPSSSYHHQSSLTQKHPPFRTNPFEQPRQILTTLLLFLLLIYLSTTNNTTTNSPIRTSITAIFISFILFTILQSRDLILTIPHPSIWRGIFGVVSFYVLFLIGLLMLDKQTARNVLRELFPDILTLDEFESKLRTSIDAVMGTCVFSRAALARQLFGCPWFLAHLMGWSCKMLIFRNVTLAMVAALLFEVCEVTFMYVVPEFEECWWDALFLDALGANVLGMVLGWYMNRWIERSVEGRVKAEFDWWGGEERRGSGEMFLEKVSILSGRWRWKVFDEPWRMACVLSMAFFMVLVELNQFLIINSFGIPNKSWFVLGRLWFVGWLAVPASAEWYKYLEDKDKMKGKMGVRFGPSIWVLFCVAFVELAVSFKFFPKHMSDSLDMVGNSTYIPYRILIPHMISLLFIVAWVILRYKIIGYTTIEFTTDEERAIVRKILDKNKDDHKSNLGNTTTLKDSFHNFMTLPTSLKRKVLMVELVDVLLLFACVPTCYLFYIGWKWI